jgi:hypothetical protein
MKAQIVPDSRGFMFIHKTVDDMPGNVLQERMKNDIERTR